MSKVSILVPIYKTEKFIERCAISLFEQTFEDIEYIFVDDCSPDNSISTLEETIGRYPNRRENIKIIRHEVNKGLASARNTAISNASGDYVIHIDSDDYIELNMIELMYSKAIQDKADIVACDFLYQWEDSARITFQSIGDNKIDFIEKMLSSQVFYSVFNKLVRRKLYIENNISAFEGVNFGEDLSTTPRLVYFANRVSKVDKPLYHYVQMNSNAYTKNIDKKGLDNLVFVFKVLDDFFKGKGENFRIAILKGKLKQKINISLSSKKLSWKDSYSIFPETQDLKDYTFLKRYESIAYFLIRNNFKFLFSVYKRLFGKAQKLMLFVKTNFQKK